VLARSRLYETAPWGDVPQGPYINASILLSISASAHELLRDLLAIEQRRGRVRDVRYGPRTLDLDVLWIEGIVVDDEVLTVPHPRLHERAFARWPLVDVAPFATDARGTPYTRGEPEGIVAITPWE
jgi:2-amino-4-hydroxy-6-hydroxymethyldihydropteridine diphosphokinase